MDKKKIDEALIDFGIAPINPAGEYKYSEHMYRHFKTLAESFEVKEPIEVTKALLENNPKPFITQYVLYGYPEENHFVYTVCFPCSAKQDELVSFEGPANISDRVLEHHVEQCLYVAHKKYVDAKAPIPVQGVFQVLPEGAERAVRNLVVDNNYTIRVHLHNVNVGSDLRATIH